MILHIVIVLNVFQYVATLPCPEGSFKNHETHQIVPDQQYSRCWEGSSCHPAILPSRLDRLTCCRCDHLAILPCLHTGWIDDLGDLDYLDDLDDLDDLADVEPLAPKARLQFSTSVEVRLGIVRMPG